MLMVVMVPTAIVAGIVGWLALRPARPNWIAVACAYAILLSPFVLAIVEWSDEGLELAIAVAGFTAITPIVGVALTAGILYKRDRAKYVPGRYSSVVKMHDLAERATFASFRERLLREVESEPDLASAEAALVAFNRRVAIVESSVALGERDPFMATEAARLAAAATESADQPQFLGILFWAIAFGTADERSAVARNWAARKWGPGDSPAKTALGDGMAALILNKADQARSSLTTAAFSETRLTLVAVAHAVIALIDRNSALFDKHILASLHEYREDYRRFPADTAGAMNVWALAACRLAIEAGSVVEERPYLPVRLLPIAFHSEHRGNSEAYPT